MTIDRWIASSLLRRRYDCDTFLSHYHIPWQWSDNPCPKKRNVKYRIPQVNEKKWVPFKKMIDCLTQWWWWSRWDWWGQFQQDLMIIFGFYLRPFRSTECHGYSALNLWKIDTKIRHTKTLRWVYEHHCIPVDEMSDLRLTWWKIIRSQANLHQENCILGHEVQSNNKKLHSERRYNKPRDSMIIERSFRVRTATGLRHVLFQNSTQIDQSRFRFEN
jgi:hypothetical protein